MLPELIERTWEHVPEPVQTDAIACGHCNELFEVDLRQDAPLCLTCGPLCASCADGHPEDCNGEDWI